jgi:leucine-rich repeat protein SHOC2
LGMLTNLEELSFQTNRLTSIPVEIGKLTKLRKLDFENNLITHIPVEIGHLVNLDVISFTYNVITAVPMEISQCAKLERIFLGSNILTYVPMEIGLLTNLRELHIYTGGINIITNVPNNVFYENKQLPLYFQYNWYRRWICRYFFLGLECDARIANATHMHTFYQPIYGPLPEHVQSSLYDYP